MGGTTRFTSVWQTCWLWDPGLLGSLVAQVWLKGNVGSTVVGQTNTTAHHEDLKSVDPQNTEKFPYVIFCAPPSGISDYVAEVRSAISPTEKKSMLLLSPKFPGIGVANNRKALLFGQKG